MTDRPDFCESMVLLVGSNPLPNYLAVHLTKPKKIYLVHTKETKGLAENLRELFQAQLNPDRVELRPLGDSTKPLAIDKFFNALFQELANGESEEFQLNYTGGTKVMAAYARMCYDCTGQGDCNASYLDDTSGVLRYDNGNELEFDKMDAQLSIDVMLEMHGYCWKPAQPFDKDDPMVADSRNIYAATSKNLDAARQLLDLLPEQEFKKARKSPQKNPLPEVVLTKNVYPEDGDTEHDYKCWRHFLRGGWLELWVADIVHSLLPATGIHTNVECFIGDTSRRFEIDVAFIHRNRLFVISCTLGDKLALCKSKLFEAAMRARQMGGDLARVALVCLLEGSSNNMANIDALRLDIAHDWASEKYIKIFGREELRNWEDGNTSRLKDWLDS